MQIITALVVSFTKTSEENNSCECFKREMFFLSENLGLGR